MSVFAEGPKPRDNRVTRVAVGLIVAAIGVVGALLLTKGTPTTTVVVASQSIAAGTPITADEVTTAQYSQDNTPATAFHSTSDVVGKYALVAFSPKSYIDQSMVSSQPAAATSPGQIVASGPFTLQPGNVAIAIPNSDAMGVAGYVQPGNHIDIIVDTTGNGTDRYLFQDVPVLATSVGSATSSSQASSSSPSSSSLLVVELPRRQAEELSAVLDAKPDANKLTPAIVRYVLRPVSQYGKGTLPGAPDTDPANGGDPPISAGDLTRIFG